VRDPHRRVHAPRLRRWACAAPADGDGALRGRRTPRSRMGERHHPRAARRPATTSAREPQTRMACISLGRVVDSCFTPASFPLQHLAHDGRCFSPGFPPRAADVGGGEGAGDRQGDFQTGCGGAGHHGCRSKATYSVKAKSLGFRPNDALKKSSMNTRKLPSRITVEGLDRAPHRAFLRALGLSDADLASRSSASLDRRAA